jgi:hypothetical protein
MTLPFLIHQTDGGVPEVLEDVLLELLLSHLHGERGLAHRAHLPRHAETPFTRVQGEFDIKCDTVNIVFYEKLRQRL